MHHPLEGTQPELQTRVADLIARAAAEGIDLCVTDGDRGDVAQLARWRQGRTTPGPIVTWARPGQSPHKYGAAADLAFLVNGAPSWAESHPWLRLGELAEACGLDWGGRWPAPKTDRPHVQLPDWRRFMVCA